MFSEERVTRQCYRTELPRIMEGIEGGIGRELGRSMKGGREEGRPEGKIE